MLITVVGSIMAVGALTRYTLFHTFRDLKTAQVNVNVVLSENVFTSSNWTLALSKTFFL